MCKAVRDGRANDWVDKDQVAVGIETSSAEGLLVDTECKATIALELIAGDAVLAELEATSGEIQKILFNVRIVADVFDCVCTEHDLEEVAFLRSKRLCKHFFTEEGSDAVQGLEVQRAVRKNLSELGVDLLHITCEVLVERAGGVDNILNARLDQVLITNISVDDLEDGLLKRDLGLEIRTLECCTSLLDANARASTTKGLKCKLILSATDNVRGCANSAKGGVVNKRRGCKRGCRDSHFLDNATHRVRDIRERAAIDGVDVG